MSDAWWMSVGCSDDVAADMVECDKRGADEEEGNDVAGCYLEEAASSVHSEDGTRGRGRRKEQIMGRIMKVPMPAPLDLAPILGAAQGVH